MERIISCTLAICELAHFACVAERLWGRYLVGHLTLDDGLILRQHSRRLHRHAALHDRCSKLLLLPHHHTRLTAWRAVHVRLWRVRRRSDVTGRMRWRRSLHLLGVLIIDRSHLRLIRLNDLEVGLVDDVFGLT